MIEDIYLQLLPRDRALTTHSFVSATYVSPVLGYTTIGLLVTCKYRTRVLPIKLAVHVNMN